jgi:hypothetical protein
MKKYGVDDLSHATSGLYYKHIMIVNCGLNYKHIMIVNDDHKWHLYYKHHKLFRSVNDPFRSIIDYSRVTLQILASLTDYSRGIIYDRNMFIVQVMAVIGYKTCFPLRQNKLECLPLTSLSCVV